MALSSRAVPSGPSAVPATSGWNARRPTAIATAPRSSPSKENRRVAGAQSGPRRREAPTRGPVPDSILTLNWRRLEAAQFLFQQFRDRQYLLLGERTTHYLNSGRKPLVVAACRHDRSRQACAVSKQDRPVRREQRVFLAVDVHGLLAFGECSGAERRTDQDRIALHEPGQFYAEGIARDRGEKEFGGRLGLGRREQPVAQALARKVDLIAQRLAQQRASIGRRVRHPQACGILNRWLRLLHAQSAPGQRLGSAFGSRADVASHRHLAASRSEERAAQLPHLDALRVGFW